ncbi:hypothetical protein DFP72DRAFT_824882 [Ephemerocybe angulata]|uniref:Uncharacterized protein n=1 Tax=Ephemerocybe angulata TaxID=980116 RepID=A0A8H6LV29_9AGAR|nr:hypothetical protein DFP72DRAFT_824882 [Tulosesus angulatus]
MFHLRPTQTLSYRWAIERTSTRRDSLRLATLSMMPLPSVPSSVLNNLAITTTILDHQSLFAHVTPLKPRAIDSLLTSHPNRSLVQSVIRVLQIGAWPFASDTHVRHVRSVPRSWHYTDDDIVSASIVYRSKEVACGRYSKSFEQLRPGMVPLPYTTANTDRGVTVVADHGIHNSDIDRTHTGIAWDDADSLHCVLRELHDTPRPVHPVILFKTKICDAFRLIPMHPCWQIKQVVVIAGQYHVDRCNSYGNRASGRLWGTVISLLLWAAHNVLGIADLFCSVDIVYSWEKSGNTSVYDGYGEPITMPSKLANLLHLWDRVGIPHSMRDHSWGECLEVNGVTLDAIQQTSSISEKDARTLAQAIARFVDPHISHRSFLDFQRIAGWMAWALQVAPTLRPGLTSIIETMRGKASIFSPTAINRWVRYELQWFASHISYHNHLRLQKWTAPALSKSDVVDIYCESTVIGAAFWIPSLLLGHRRRVQRKGLRASRKFYWDAFAVVSALKWVASNMSPRSMLCIHSTNPHIVASFNSMNAGSLYDVLMLSAADAIISAELIVTFTQTLGKGSAVARYICNLKKSSGCALYDSVPITVRAMPLSVR